MNDEAALIRRAIAVASRAPSLHNSQPWRWVADGARLELFLDPSRVVTHTDSAGREALIGCGAILDHLRVMMAAAGRRTTVERFPDPADPTHLASVLWHHAGPVPDSTLTVHRDRASAILRRRTDRLPFLPPIDWDPLSETLHGLLDPDVVRLHVISSELLPELAEGSRLTTEIRRLDVRYHQELDWWTGPFETDDGIPRELLASVFESQRVAVNRTFPAGAHGNRRSQVHTDQAMVVVLSTPDDTPADALAAGEALSALLIEATVAGLATCTVSHLTELESGRALVRSLIADEGHPQVLVRVGRAPALEGPTVTTPRRPVSDILEFRG
jgi:nitroreductase